MLFACKSKTEKISHALSNWKFEIQKWNCSASDLIRFGELHLIVVRSGCLKFMTFGEMNVRAYAQQYWR